jgi:hypothetical protein
MTLSVLCCRSDRTAAEADSTVREALARCGPRPVEFVGPRPGKEIDPMLTDRVVVIGDDSDLAAVALRLLRRELLGAVIVGFATDRATSVTDLWSLPLGAAGLELALVGDPDLVPLVRDDVGGVLVGLGTVMPVRGTVYVDETRALSGQATHVLVEPDNERGLVVTLLFQRILGVGRRPRTYRGRAVQIGTTPASVISDGKVFARQMDRWIFYKHTEPLRLVRGLL